MDHDRVPQNNDEEETPIGGLLEEASLLARRVLESVQEAAGTAYCKGVQLNELKKFAKKHGVWIEDALTLGIFTDRGSENEVYLSTDGLTVYKLNDFRYAEDNLTSFFERIVIHNSLFPDCAYSLIGFAHNQEGRVCAVLSQPFIKADREASKEEIAGALALMGFLPQLDGEYFSNGDLDIFDALPNNVLHGIDGMFYFIDTIIYVSNDANMDIYKSLSPRFS